MPRRINKKCVSCAQISAAEARLVHGKEGDRCWDDKCCPRRRSHYRNRRRVNEERRSHYRQQNSQEMSEPVETVAISAAEAPAAPYANLYIWREKRKDAPLHAIAATASIHQ